MSKELIERLHRLGRDSVGNYGMPICVEAADRIEELERELRETEIRLHDVATLCAIVEQERDTAWAQAHRLALELECLIMDTKDNAIVSKWWDSAFEAIEEYNTLKPGAAEDAEAWAKMRKAGI